MARVSQELSEMGRQLSESTRALHTSWPSAIRQIAAGVTLGTGRSRSFEAAQRKQVLRPADNQLQCFRPLRCHSRRAAGEGKRRLR